MITITAKISQEDLEDFNKNTDSEITSEVTLRYTKNDLTGEYYLAFVNDLIVIHNDVVTLNHGVITPESLTYLQNETANSIKNISALDAYYQEGVYSGKV